VALCRPPRDEAKDQEVDDRIEGAIVYGLGRIDRNRVRLPERVAGAALLGVAGSSIVSLGRPVAPKPAWPAVPADGGNSEESTTQGKSSRSPRSSAMSAGVALVPRRLQWLEPLIEANGGGLDNRRRKVHWDSDDIPPGRGADLGYLDEREFLARGWRIGKSGTYGGEHPEHPAVSLTGALNKSLQIGTCATSAPQSRSVADPGRRLAWVSETDRERYRSRPAPLHRGSGALPFAGENPSFEGRRVRKSGARVASIEES
jgi:hypothetical protein